MNPDDMVANAINRIADQLAITPAFADQLNLRNKVKLIINATVAAQLIDTDYLAADVIMVPACKAMAALINALMIDADINTLPLAMIESLLIEVIGDLFND